MGKVEIAAQILKQFEPYSLPESRDVRKKQSLLYGETPFETAGTLLGKYARPTDKIFYDLGSGIGNVVIRAALSDKFTKVTGIEIVGERHELSLKALLQCRPLLPEKTDVKLIREDFLKADFSDADIVYVTAVAFGKKLMKDLQSRLTTLKSGTRIIIADKQLDPKQFSLIDKINLPMDYADADFYVYEKK